MARVLQSRAVHPPDSVLSRSRAHERDDVQTMHVCRLTTRAVSECQNMGWLDPLSGSTSGGGGCMLLRPFSALRQGSCCTTWRHMAVSLCGVPLKIPCVSLVTCGIQRRILENRRPRGQRTTEPLPFKVLNSPFLAENCHSWAGEVFPLGHGIRLRFPYDAERQPRKKR